MITSKEITYKTKSKFVELGAAYYGQRKDPYTECYYHLGELWNGKFFVATEYPDEPVKVDVIPKSDFNKLRKAADFKHADKLRFYL